MRRNKIVDKITASQFHGSETASGEQGRVRRTKQTDYQLVPFPKSRRLIMASLNAWQHVHFIHAFLEVDVTTVRTYLREQKSSTGEAFSFTAFIATCLARAVDENISLQAYRMGRNQLVLFEEVDIAILVERELGDQKFPLDLVVRAANRKTIQQIHDEIRAAQVEPVQQFQEWKTMRWFLLLPTFLRDFLMQWLRKHPHKLKRETGTVGLTAIGMFGKGVGWGLPLPTHNLFLTLGGMSKKLGVVDGGIAIREYLCLTVSLNHDMIDGAPAAHFISRLKELIESGFGLLDQDAMAEQPACPVGEAASQGRMQKEVPDDGKTALTPGDIPALTRISPLPSRDEQGQSSHEPS